MDSDGKLASLRRGDALHIECIKVSWDHIKSDLPAFFVAYEFHDQHIFSDFERFWGVDARSDEAFQITHLLFCPQAHHLSWIPAVTAPKAVFACYILVSVLEYKDRGLVNFDGKMFAIWTQCVVDIRLTDL